MSAVKLMLLKALIAFSSQYALAQVPKPIPEVMSLPANSTLSRDLYLKYDVNYIAYSLVERLKKIRPSKTSESYFDFYKDSRIQMLFSSQHIESIQQKGFLNGHQVPGGAGASYSKEQRMMALTDFGTEPDILFNVNQLICKYAYLGLTKESSKVWRTRLDPNLYGNVVAVFKDRVKNRTTFTPGNSQMIPESAHALNFRTLNPFVEPDYQRGSWGHHWEAQIWGRLTVDDVDYFMINCPFLKKANGWYAQDLASDRVVALSRLGKPIFKCENDAADSVMYPGVLIKTP